MNDYLLFDLDGTLTDPKKGITGCVQYALKHFGIEEPDLDKLEPFIGPPLKESFMKFYGFDEAKAQKGVEKYRERFQDTGIFENQMYPGIRKLLGQCKKRGAVLAVASSKPTVFVERILEHFHIARYFDVVVGSELDGRRSDKGDVIEETLRRLFPSSDIDYDNVVMVGDRKFDINGARKNKIVSVAVAYGYGGMQELKEAKPDYIVRSVEELEELLLRGREKPQSGLDDKQKNQIREMLEKQREESFVRKLWNLFSPLAFYFLLTDVMRMLLTFAAILIFSSVTPAAAMQFVVLAADGGTIAGLNGTMTGVVNALCFLISFLMVYKTMAKADLIQARFVYRIHSGENSKKNQPRRMTAAQALHAVCILVLGISLSVGLNFLSALLGFTQSSESFEAVSQRQMSVAAPVGLLLYGVLSPLAEETIFRGVIFNRMKRYFPWILSVVLSSAVFGLYHGNWIQAVYGFLMGMILASLYHGSGRFHIPVILHGIMNVTAFLLNTLGVFDTAFYNWGVCIAGLGVAGILCFVFYSMYQHGWEA